MVVWMLLLHTTHSGQESGTTASLVLLSQLQPLSRSQSSTLTLFVPLVLRDGTSGLTSTSTVTVSVCPCLRGGARAGEKEKNQQVEGEWDSEREAVCLPQQSTLPSPWPQYCRPAGHPGLCCYTTG
ncbi:unnamed protein product [Pleuronectes platessa]|uniref:Uncharacterized protein n=1 Tax=Pleuronectes platessa TaxID=8262 RepID=A0A9N7UPJ6_PLEPL|nr:unnamed protein product [Pleuronectes platessa]